MHPSVSRDFQYINLFLGGSPLRFKQRGMRLHLIFVSEFFKLKSRSLHQTKHVSKPLSLGKSLPCLIIILPSSTIQIVLLLYSLQNLYYP